MILTTNKPSKKSSEIFNNHSTLTSAVQDKVQARVSVLPI